MILPGNALENVFVFWWWWCWLAYHAVKSEADSSEKYHCEKITAILRIMKTYVHMYMHVSMCVHIYACMHVPYDPCIY